MDIYVLYHHLCRLHRSFVSFSIRPFSLVPQVFDPWDGPDGPLARPLTPWLRKTRGFRRPSASCSPPGDFENYGWTGHFGVPQFRFI
jgi:hypothetical protein